MPRVNSDITSREVRLVGSGGEQIGVVSIDEALAQADEEGLDLVEVAPGTKPPVVKIMDFGKYRYDQQKKLRESRKKQHTVAVKEVRMRPSIGEHDLQTKMTAAIKFLKEGSRLKVSVRFRGREMSRQDLGAELLERVVEALEEYAIVDKSPVMEGRMMTIHLLPK